jgi:hypothetical protein
MKNLSKSKDEKSIDLSYTIFQDEEDMSVYIKFEGFYTDDQLETFEQFIESYLPLIFASEDVAN